MNDEAVNILSQSKRRLTKLKLLANFFENVDIIAIYIKTDSIHNLFQKNKGLDYSKLELFHLQYTDSLIELLTKIKRQKENDMLAVINEIEINRKYISEFEEKQADGFETDRKIYSGNFSRLLKNLYQDLTENKYTINWSDVLYFYRKYAVEFYRSEVAEEQLKAGTFPAYRYQDYQIERKLLGRLNIQNFKVRFVCGYAVSGNEYELFKIFQSEDFFMFDIEGQKMYLMDPKKMEKLNMRPNESNRAIVINQLKKKNEDLEEAMAERKRTLPDQVTAVLKDYIKNLENTDVMSKMFDINEETNILRAMLNLNLNNN
ncbi:hypothetical protein EG349_16545 [Chryseobacterium shandongense]|uniref:Rho-GAP domain-containing protein n=1 Tax=Chryseobacterium shandongense TaxID=1493872 RepID=A0AAD0YGU6_9FLAO|nr:hypothetical protein [Chryseobacterium shandongense]AZA88269.1 hypothetical protein EG349_16545 [Chryseobacterium shandongense]AZA96831.1 hypothetical protein EG353_15335 [Chryseobacterium shandongense]